MPIADVFANDCFKVKSLTDAINLLPYKPARLGQMGLFEQQGVTTTTVMLEESNGVIALLPTVPRGAPATKSQGAKRRARAFVVPHIPLEDTLLADAVQDVRAFGTDNQLATVAQIVNDRMQVMRQSHEATHEYHRIGAVKGIILDADGVTTIYNLFTEFGIQQTTVDFALAVPATDVRDKCLSVLRAIEAALGMSMYTGVRALCGATWFANLVKHEDVKAAYENYLEGQYLRNDPRNGFEFGGITFEEYRGAVSGQTFVADDRAHFFPVGVPGLFKHYMAPANFMETVNTIGLPVYAKQEALPLNTGVLLHTQSNPLMMCTRPACLILGT